MDYALKEDGNADRKEGKISARVNGITAKVAYLKGNLDDLAERLNPILIPEKPENGIDPNPKGATCPMDAALEIIEHRLMDINDFVDILKNRIQL